MNPNPHLFLLSTNPRPRSADHTPTMSWVSCVSCTCSISSIDSYWRFSSSRSRRSQDLRHRVGISYRLRVRRVLHFCGIALGAAGRPLGAAKPHCDQHCGMEHYDCGVRPGARIYRLGVSADWRRYRRSRRDAASALTPFGLLPAGETRHRAGYLCEQRSGWLRLRVLVRRNDQ